MDQVMQFVEPGRQFIKDSVRLVKRCTKPDRKGRILLFGSASTLINPALLRTPDMIGTTEHNRCRLLPFDNTFLPLEFQKIAMATAIGFAIMGFIGFFVKLIHIPINNIIV